MFHFPAPLPGIKKTLPKKSSPHLGGQVQHVHLSEKVSHFSRFKSFPGRQSDHVYRTEKSVGIVLINLWRTDTPLALLAILLPQAVSAAFAHYFEANDLYCGASYTVRFPNWLCLCKLSIAAAYRRCAGHRKSHSFEWLVLAWHRGRVPIILRDCETSGVRHRASIMIFHHCTSGDQIHGRKIRCVSSRRGLPAADRFACCLDDLAQVVRQLVAANHYKDGSTGYTRNGCCVELDSHGHLLSTSALLLRCAGLNTNAPDRLSGAFGIVLATLLCSS